MRPRKEGATTAKSKGGGKKGASTVAGGSEAAALADMPAKGASLEGKDKSAKRVNIAAAAVLDEDPQFFAPCAPTGDGNQKKKY